MAGLLACLAIGGIIIDSVVDPSPWSAVLLLVTLMALPLAAASYFSARLRIFRQLLVTVAAGIALGALWVASQPSDPDSFAYLVLFPALLIGVPAVGTAWIRIDRGPLPGTCASVVAAVVGVVALAGTVLFRTWSPFQDPNAMVAIHVGGLAACIAAVYALGGTGLGLLLGRGIALVRARGSGAAAEGSPQRKLMTSDRSE